MSSERCVVCDHTEAETSAADYLFRLRVFNTDTKSAYFVDIHLRCIGARVADYQHCLFQCIGRVKDINEAERIARVLEKRAAEDASTIFEEPTYDENAEDPDSQADPGLNGASPSEGSTSGSSERDESSGRPHLRLLA